MVTRISFPASAYITAAGVRLRFPSHLNSIRLNAFTLKRRRQTIGPSATQETPPAGPVLTPLRPSRKTPAQPASHVPARKGMSPKNQGALPPPFIGAESVIIPHPAQTITHPKPRATMKYGEYKETDTPRESFPSPSS